MKTVVTQTHGLPSPLSALMQKGLGLDPASVAYWAYEKARACLIFIHGYGGTAVDTWGGFKDLAISNPDLRDTDILFLGYPSRSSRAAYNVGLLYRTLELLLDEPDEFCRLTFGPARGPDFLYDKVILVGHSLGGALARGVAQAAGQQKKPWADILRLALFAPAHMGADVLQLAKMAAGVSRWGGPAIAALLAREQALIDLQPGSDFLQQLMAQALALKDHPVTLASLVVHAENDPVVSPNPYYRDPPCTPYAGRDHVNCCKPMRALFELPVNDVVQVRVSA